MLKKLCLAFNEYGTSIVENRETHDVVKRNDVVVSLDEAVELFACDVNGVQSVGVEKMQNIHQGFGQHDVEGGCCST